VLESRVVEACGRGSLELEHMRGRGWGANTPA
jgi:hypothetical protein